MFFGISSVSRALCCSILASAALVEGIGIVPRPAPISPPHVVPVAPPVSPPRPAPVSPPVSPPRPAPVSPPVSPPRVPPVSPPRVPAIPHVPLKPPVIVELPRPKDPLIDDDASVFSLGSYKENHEQVLFENFEGPAEPYFSKMYDFFAAKETRYLGTENVYAKATGTEQPFKSGYSNRPTGQPLRFTATTESNEQRITVTATFNPAEPTDVCRQWRSLASYCGDEGEACACYSGTYYVPDQWNSLAAGCAVLTTTCDESMDVTDDAWCRIAKTASEYTSYCTSDASAVSFAARANIKNPAPETTSEATSEGPGGATLSVNGVAASSSMEPMSRPTATSVGPLDSWGSRSLNLNAAKWYTSILFIVFLF